MNFNDIKTKAELAKAVNCPKLEKTFRLIDEFIDHDPSTEPVFCEYDEEKLENLVIFAQLTLNNDDYKNFYDAYITFT